MELREQAASDALKAGPVASEYASRLHKLRQGTSCKRRCRKQAIHSKKAFVKERPMASKLLAAIKQAEHWTSL